MFEEHYRVLTSTNVKVRIVLKRETDQGCRQSGFARPRVNFLPVVREHWMSQSGLRPSEQ